MGGIAGVIRFDGKESVNGAEIKLTSALRHRGSQQTKRITEGVLLNFGGSVEEDLTSGLCVTADAIFYSPIDETISAGYSRYGIPFFNTLHADFAFVIWNPQTQELIGVRDPLGVKPFYYVYLPGRFFAFSSEIKGLLSLNEVTHSPNEHKFREYLTWPTDYVPYSAETFYKDIYSVLPGHVIQVTADQVETLPFWQPNLGQFALFTDSTSFTEGFRSLFYTAIERRMELTLPVGAHLSGGLDSSSVCCVAQSILNRQQRPNLLTFNIDTELPSADEQVYVQAVQEAYPLNHHRLRPLTNILDSVLTIQHQFDRPEQFIIPSSFHLSVARRAQQLGCKVILTGHDGDSVAVNGFNIIDQLLQDADWESLLQACSQYVSVSERNLTTIHSHWRQLSQSVKLKKYILHLLGSKVKQQLKSHSVGQFAYLLVQQKQALDLSLISLVSEVTKRLWQRLAHRKLIDNAFSADFKKRTAHWQPLSTASLTSSIHHEFGISVAHLINTTNVVCNEQLNHIGTYAGHTYSFPFFDQRVIDLSLATPLAVHFDQGRGRGLIRLGLRNIVPPSILTRYTKANFLEYGHMTAQQLHEVTLDVFLERNHPIWKVIDKKVYDSIVKVVYNAKIPLASKVRYNWLLSRIIYLGLWLKV